MIAAPLVTPGTTVRSAAGAVIIAAPPCRPRVRPWQRSGCATPGERDHTGLSPVATATCLCTRRGRMDIADTAGLSFHAVRTLSRVGWWSSGPCPHRGRTNPCHRSLGSLLRRTTVPANGASDWSMFDHLHTPCAASSPRRPPSRSDRRRPPTRRTPRRCRRAANTRPSSVPCASPCSRFLPSPWPRVAPRRASPSQYRRHRHCERPGRPSCAGDAPGAAVLFRERPSRRTPGPYPVPRRCARGRCGAVALWRAGPGVVPCCRGPRTMGGPHPRVKGGTSVGPRGRFHA